ncbi:putative reverse transcriptase domain-containing protein [Tanacetum coccineum]
MSDSEHSTVTYTSISSDYEEPSDIGSLGVIVYGYDGLPMHPPSLDYVPGPEHPPSPDYMPGPEHPPLPIYVPYVPKPTYPEFIPPEDDVFPAKEQPLPVVVSPIADSPDDDEEEEEESSEDDVDDKDEDEDKKEEEHLASANSVLPPTYRTTARMSIQAQKPIPFPSEAEVSKLLAIPTPSPSPFTSYSSPLPHILSPPLPVSSPLPMLPPSLPISPTHPLRYRADMIRLRAESPSTSHPLPLPPPIVLPHTRDTTTLPIPLPISSPPLLLPSTDCRADAPEVTLPPQKRLCIALDPRYEIGENSFSPTTRPTRGFRADFRFVGTLDAKIRRDLDREDTDEIYGRLDEAHDDRSLMSELLVRLGYSRWMPVIRHALRLRFAGSRQQTTGTARRGNDSARVIAGLDGSTTVSRRDLSFTARKFTETELCDVIGTVVSVSDAIPFNNYGKDQLRRTIILEDVQESMGHVVIILQLCKVKYFNAKPSVSPAMYSTKLYLNDDIQEIATFRQSNDTIAVYYSVKKEHHADDFFKGASEDCWEYKAGTIAYFIAKFHKNFISENGWDLLGCKTVDGVGDLLTPLLDTAKSSRFSNVANIPFNLEDSPQTADGTTEGNGTNTNGEGCSKETENDGGDSGSGKRTIIDLDDYYEKPAVAKRNKVIQIGESSFSPTTRPTRGFRADYGFVGTLDAKIRRDLDREDTDEIYGRLDDAHDDRSLMSASREAWVQSMDASDTACSEIGDLLAADSRRQAQLVEAMTLLESLQTQMVALQSQQRPVRDPTHPDVTEEAGSSS